MNWFWDFSIHCSPWTLPSDACWWLSQWIRVLRGYGRSNTDLGHGVTWTVAVNSDVWVRLQMSSLLWLIFVLSVSWKRSRKTHNHRSLNKNTLKSAITVDQTRNYFWSQRHSVFDRRSHKIMFLFRKNKAPILVTLVLNFSVLTIK